MILIIQNGYLDTAIHRYLDDEYRIVKSYSQINRNKMDPIKDESDIIRSGSVSCIANTEVDNIDLDEYDAVIILGGHQSVRNIEKYKSLQAVVRLIDKCYKENKPVLGICLGSQLIAHYSGCEIKKCDHIKVGYDVDITINNITYNNIFRAHHDCIVPNDNIQVLYSYENMPYLIKNKCLIGIQCHPDIPPTEVNRFISIDNLRKRKNHSSMQVNLDNKSIMDWLIAQLKEIR